MKLHQQGHMQEIELQSKKLGITTQWSYFETKNSGMCSSLPCSLIFTVLLPSLSLTLFSLVSLAYCVLLPLTVFAPPLQSMGEGA